MDSVTNTLLDSALTVASRKAYQRSIDKFGAFCLTYLKLTVFFPAQACLVVSFVAHLFQSGYAYSSITSSLSAISYVHKLHQIADPTANLVVQKLLQGASRLRPSIDVRAPVTKSILHSLVRSTSAVTNCFFASTLLSSMYLLAFHAFLRIGEIVVTSASKIDTVLQIHQISIEENKCTIVFYAYKHYIYHLFAS